VDRNADGVFITGAKMHISASSIEHELVIMPTKAMYPGEEDYAIACAVPVNARGVSIIDMTYAPRAEDVRHYPVSGKVNCPEGFVVFDNVFVPNERVFLDGETAHAATLAHSLGLWERAAGLGDAGESADREVGMAALLAEANGMAGDPALVNATKTEDGNMLPSPLFVSALKYFKSEFRARLLDIQHDIAGDLLVNAPTVGDFEHPDLHAALGEAFEVPGFTAEDRLRLFHYVRDTTAD